MQNLRRTFSEAGYNQEDAFIYKLEREQAEKRKRKAEDEARAQAQLPEELPKGHVTMKKAG